MSENYSAEEFKKSQEDFKAQISSSGLELGIEGELLNMRSIRYVISGKAGVEMFDQKLSSGFGHFQEFLMSDVDENWNLDLLTKSKKMYEVLCAAANATDAFSVTRNFELNKLINECLGEIKMENIL